MKNIRLINYQDSYLSELYNVYSDQEQRLNILPKKQYVTIEQFEPVFKRHIESKYTEFKIICKDDGCFIGFAIAYDYMKNDSHVKITIYIIPKYQKMGYGIISAVSFIDYIFTYYNINKIFTEVYEFNQESLKIHDSIGLTKEACLREYKYYNGKFHDMYVYSMTRKVFYEVVDKMKFRFMLNQDVKQQKN